MVAGAFVPGIGVGGSRVAFVFVVSRFATRCVRRRSWWRVCALCRWKTATTTDATAGAVVVAGLCPMATENRHHDARHSGGARPRATVTDPPAPPAGTALLHHRRERATQRLAPPARRALLHAPRPPRRGATAPPADKGRPPFIDAVLPAPHAAPRHPPDENAARRHARPAGRRPDLTHRRQPANLRPRVLAGPAATPRCGGGRSPAVRSGQPASFTSSRQEVIHGRDRSRRDGPDRLRRPVRPLGARQLAATEIDFTQDRIDWHERFTPEQRRGALWLYTLFFHGEDSVADNLSPYIDAAPLEEQKYFLATQQVDEARHAVFFQRFMHEVVGLGDGTLGGGLRATLHELSWGHRKTFGRLDQMADELRKDHSPRMLAKAVTMYHIIVEGTLAQPGQHMIETSLERLDLLPGFREGLRNVATDEQRHIAFGVKLLADLYRDDPQARRTRSSTSSARSCRTR